MNFFSIAVKNIKKKLFNYITYFFSTTFAVTVFYIFCSIYFNPQFANYNTGVTKMGIIFKVSSIAVLIFSSIFIFYSNSLFIKTRKKEIAIYSLLGMHKRDIGRMLFYETFLVGLCSIAVGILLGMLFSRFFSMVLMKLMLAGAQGSNLSFSVSWQPAVVTIILFVILFVINAVISLRTIYQYKLIDLLSADKQGENAPKFSALAAVCSLLLIAIAYFILLSFNGNDGAMKLIFPAFIACALLVIGTYLLFRNLVIWLTTKLKSNQEYYFKTRNFLSTSQIVYRIKANSNILCLISLLSALTITAMSVSFAFYTSLYDVMPVYSPFSYLVCNVDNSTANQMIETAHNNTNVKLNSITKFTVITTNASLNGYRTDTKNKYGQSNTELGQQFNLDIIKFSDYKAIVKNTKATYSKGNKGAIYQSDLIDGECLFLDGNYSDNFSKDAAGTSIDVIFGNQSDKFSIISSSLFKYMGAGFARTTIVVSDSDYGKYFTSGAELKKKNFIGLNFDKPMDSKILVDELNQIVPEKNRDKSYYEYCSLMFSSYGAYIFIGTFLGILFLLAAGSIIFYKQLMEAKDETGRYDILKKIGLSRSEASQSIRKQVMIIFLLPFIVGIAHSVVALITYRNMMYTISADSPILGHAAAVVLLYLLIYGFFYLLSVNGYMRTVWGKKV